MISNLLQLALFNLRFFSKKGKINPLWIPVIVIGNKYDIFMKEDP